MNILSLVEGQPKLVCGPRRASGPAYIDLYVDVYRLARRRAVTSFRDSSSSTSPRSMAPLINAVSTALWPP